MCHGGVTPDQKWAEIGLSGRPPYAHASRGAWPPTGIRHRDQAESTEQPPPLLQQPPDILQLATCRIDLVKKSSAALFDDSFVNTAIFKILF